MYLEEKLDLLKKELYPEHLTIRYNDFKEIIDKIESKYLHFDNLNFKYSGWKERLKDFEESSFKSDVFDFIDRQLKEKQKYWWVFVDPPNHSNSRHRIFDATTKGGKRLAVLFQDSPIFIIEKKYKWMMAIDPKNGTVKENKPSQE